MDEYIQQMIDWMESRLKDRFSLNDLADYVGYSPYYCSFKFHQATGMSLRRYVLLRRLYESLNDLKDQRKILEVALEFGYSSQEAYSRAFKNVFGLSPREFQLHAIPVQSFPKIQMDKTERMNSMEGRKEQEMIRLHAGAGELFDSDVLNILNGQMMYEEFSSKKLMGDSAYVPFNEAMCVHDTTEHVFGEAFIALRAAGHGETPRAYVAHVLTPLQPLFSEDYTCIVLWFGEDMFCQMNVLTLLAYLEQANFKGRVILNSFREDEFKVEQTELVLGHYQRIYKRVLMEKKEPDCTLLPVMHQAVDWYLTMQKTENPVTRFIKQNRHLTRKEVLQKLMAHFQMIGYGDLQYIELLDRMEEQ